MRHPGKLPPQTEQPASERTELAAEKKDDPPNRRFEAMEEVTKKVRSGLETATGFSKTALNTRP